jgi:two-component system sensor histidine kinase BaeS
MRLTIGTRIFLALTAVSLVILTLNAAVTRWNFQRGFLEYTAEQELATIREAASTVAEIYRREGGWSALRDNPRRWNDLLRSSSGPPRHDGRPGPGGPPGRPPPDDPLELGRRIALLDQGGELIAGRPESADPEHAVPIVVDGTTVGYVSIAPRRQLTGQVDRNFAREQDRSIFAIAVAALLLAALISAVLARQLTRPIRSLASGARAIADGDYHTRIPSVRNDELGDLADEFNRLSETLERNRASRRQWVSDIAHELRTPLSVLRGELDAIEDGVRTFDVGTQKSLQAETARLTRLVGELHDLSVYDEGGLDYRREKTDIVALLRDVLAGAEKRLGEAGIRLEHSLPEREIVVAVDSAKLERVFMNLIENTLRYTDKPGELAVTCAAEDASVIIDFADSAPGVPDRALSRMFDRLFRVDASRSRDTGGSGLGLAICKAIVESHDGSIAAAAADLGGVSIRIRLPVADERAGVQ